MFRSTTIVSSFEVEMNGDSWIQTIRSLAMTPAFRGTRLESAVGSLVEVFALVEIRNGDSIDLSDCQLLHTNAVEDDIK